MENVCNTMLYMIFKYGSELVLIHRILIGFEVILDNGFLFYDPLLNTYKLCIEYF